MYATAAAWSALLDTLVRSSNANGAKLPESKPENVWKNYDKALSVEWCALYADWQCGNIECAVLLYMYF